MDNIKEIRELRTTLELLGQQVEVLTETIRGTTGALRDLLEENSRLRSDIAAMRRNDVAAQEILLESLPVEAR